MQGAQEMQVQSLGQEDPLEEEMAAHPSILAWRDAVHGVAKSLHAWAHTHNMGTVGKNHDTVEGTEVKQIITKSKIVVLNF